MLMKMYVNLNDIDILEVFQIASHKTYQFLCFTISLPLCDCVLHFLLL